MAGPTVHKPALPHEFTNPLSPATDNDARILLKVMALVHSVPMEPAFNALQLGKVDATQGLALSHLFEEIGALVLHRLVNRDLLFDAYAFDVYWTTLSRTVLAARRKSGNPKFGENFELMAEMASDYRRQRPAKTVSAN